MYKAFLHTHWLAVTIFFLIYVIKTVLLLSNRQDLLQKFTKVTKIPEMIVSTLFLVTGVYMLTQVPEIKTIMIVKIALVLTSIPVAIIGFKKGNKILAALALLMITASYGLAEMSRKRKVTVPTEGVAATDGKSLYEANCKLCHGDDGKLAAMGAADLSKTTMDAATVKQTILNGKGNMAKIEMSDEQASAIATYLEESVKGK
jgi:mono/diheme cytochrome c family protein